MKNILIVLLSITVSASAQTYHRVSGTNIVQSTHSLPSLSDGVSRARFTSAHYAAGWRIEQTEAAPTGVVAQAWETVVDGNRVVTRPSLMLPIADYEAQQAADEAKRRETPIPFDQPIQARIEIPAAPDHYYRLEVDQDSGEVYPVEIESDRLTPEQYDATNSTVKAERVKHRERMKGINKDLDTAQRALNDINTSPTGTLGNAISAIDPTLLSGNAKTVAQAQKAALTETRKVLADMKVVLNNLTQSANKMQREIR